MEKLNRCAQVSREETDEESLAPTLRARQAERTMAKVYDALEQVLSARTDEDRARLVEFEQRAGAPSEAARVAHKLVALRRQVTWGKTVDLAQLVCVLMVDSAGGEVMSSDEAGVSVGEDDRRLVVALLDHGRRLRAKGPR